MAGLGSSQGFRSVWFGVQRVFQLLGVESIPIDPCRLSDRYQDLPSPAVLGHPLTTKRLFLDTSWKVLVLIFMKKCSRTVARYSIPILVTAAFHAVTF